MLNQDMKNLKPRSTSIICTDHPEWGTWGIMENRGDWYEIIGRAGSRILSKDEAVKFWNLATGSK